MSTPELIIEKKWSSRPGNVQCAREAARAILTRYIPDDADLVELAIGEACANAVEHGSPGEERDYFILRCFISKERDSLFFEVEDCGQEFNVTNLSLAGAPDLLSEHGRGLFLINQIMDEVVIGRAAEGLNVRMSKTLKR